MFTHLFASTSLCLDTFGGGGKEVRVRSSCGVTVRDMLQTEIIYTNLAVKTKAKIWVHYSQLHVFRVLDHKGIET